MSKSSTLRNAALNFVAGIVIAITAQTILAASKTADSPADTAKTQAAASNVSPPQSDSDTPASMNYHDGINVSAIAIAAYKH
jgi:hypothetical protein